MQLISAIKMKKAQLAAVEARPYQEHLESVIKRVMTRSERMSSPLLVSHSKSKTATDLIIVLSGNQGMCGSFNIDLFRLISTQVDMSRTKFITIGKKASEFLSKTGEVLADYSSSTPMNNVSAAIDLARKSFLEGTYEKVFILFNRFISTLKTEPELVQLMPYTLHLDQSIEEKENIEYLIEPNPQQIIDTILNSFVEEKVRNALIQSEAGEHSARMIAMKNATDNANDVIYNLTLLGNKLRQEKITNELLDMITAKESVEQT